MSPKSESQPSAGSVWPARVVGKRDFKICISVISELWIDGRGRLVIVNRSIP